MAFDVTGKLHKKFPTETRGEKGFQTRDFVLEVSDGQYPQLIKFQAVQDRCAMLDTYEENEEVKVHFDLRGREWQGKYLTNLNCWRIEKGTNASPSTATPVQQVAATSAADNLGKFPTLKDEPLQDADDLPF